MLIHPLVYKVYKVYKVVRSGVMDFMDLTAKLIYNEEEGFYCSGVCDFVSAPFFRVGNGLFLLQDV